MPILVSTGYKIPLLLYSFCFLVLNNNTVTSTNRSDINVIWSKKISTLGLTVISSQSIKKPYLVPKINILRSPIPRTQSYTISRVLVPFKTYPIARLNVAIIGTQVAL